MIKQDQPTIFDSAKLGIVISSKDDGNTKSNNTEDLEGVTKNTKSIVRTVGLEFGAIIAMDVGQLDQWDKIVEVTKKPDHALISIEDRVVADALVTNVAGIVLQLPVADCNAVAIHDPVKNVLAFVHLGWKSTVVELAAKSVRYLKEHYQSSPADLRVYFSPAIKAESYVFESVSQADDSDWQPYLAKVEKGVGVDLPGYNRQRFIEAGVLPEHIEVSSVNTATSDKYYSHYRSVRTGEPEGRFSLFATLKEK